MKDTLAKKDRRMHGRDFLPSNATKTTTEAKCLFLALRKVNSRMRMIWKKLSAAKFHSSSVFFSRLYLFKSKMKLSMLRDFSVTPLPAFPKSSALLNEVLGVMQPWRVLPATPSLLTVLVIYYISVKAFIHTFSSVI